jgi:hypothetical protein
MPRKRKELNTADFYNWWLSKYHNTTVEEIMEKEPELCTTVDWYKKYSVSPEQHDEWYEWAINTIADHFRCSKKTAKRMFCFDYLNVAPSIKDEI